MLDDWIKTVSRWSSFWLHIFKSVFIRSACGGAFEYGFLIEVLTKIWRHLADVRKVYQDVTNPLYSGSLLNVSIIICLSFSDTSAGIHYLASAGLIRGWTGFRAWWSSVSCSLTWHLVYLNYQHRHLCSALGDFLGDGMDTWLLALLRTGVFWPRALANSYTTSLRGNDVPNMSSTWLTESLFVCFRSNRANWSCVFPQSKTRRVMLIRLTFNLLHSIYFTAKNSI